LAALQCWFQQTRLIENNPVKAGFVAEPGDFAWSSAEACLKQAAG